MSAPHLPARRRGRATSALLFVAGISSLPAPSIAGPPLEPVTHHTIIQPQRIASVRREDGRIIINGDWVASSGTGARAARFNLPAFDCFGRTNRPFATPGLGTHGAFGPMSCVGPGGSTIDDGTRWSLGTAYANANTVEDLHDVCAPPGAAISELDFAWLWNPPVPSQLFVIVLPFEEALEFDPIAGACNDPSKFTDTGGGGIALDFGVLPSGGSTAYVALVSGLDFLGALLPSTDDDGNGLPDGSYQLLFATSIDNPCDPLPCPPAPAQPLLWGTGDATGEPARCGRNNARSFNDDNPPDGVLDAQCTDDARGLCPDPLGKCVAFCVLSCAADLNHDGFVDGIDADGFANDFEAGSIDADLNGDGFMDGIDADLFYNAFEEPCP